MSEEELRALDDGKPSAEEKVLLDHELEEHRKNPKDGSPWNEVERRLLKRKRTE
jgi:hypothetical protein